MFTMQLGPTPRQGVVDPGCEFDSEFLIECAEQRENLDCIKRHFTAEIQRHKRFCQKIHNRDQATGILLIKHVLKGVR